MPLLTELTRIRGWGYKDFAPTELIIRSKSRKRHHTVEDEDDDKYEDDMIDLRHRLLAPRF